LQIDAAALISGAATLGAALLIGQLAHRLTSMARHAARASRAIATARAFLVTTLECADHALEAVAVDATRITQAG
jgi:hypothetical protein